MNIHIFLEKYFRECAVFVPSQIENRFAFLEELLYNLDPVSILRNTSSDAIFVWLKTDSGLVNSIEVADADTAIALHNAGHATYCRAPPSVEQHLVSSLLTDTGLGCGQYDPSGESMTKLGRGEVEVFISTKNHTTGWHTDFQENFTLQLSGIKRWVLHKGSVRHPLRGCTPHYASPSSVEPQLKAARLADPNFQFRHPVAGVNAVGEPDTVTLKPGDVLYFPAGMWHKVETIEVRTNV
jgi:hypothetical protein